MKRSFSLAAVLSVAALTSGVVLASMNATLACPFSKNNGMTPRNDENSPVLSSKQLNVEDTNTNNNPLGIIVAGVAAIAGLGVAGMVYRARQNKQDDAVVADMPQAEPFAATSFPIPIPADALSASTSEPESLDASDSSSDRDLTRIG